MQIPSISLALFLPEFPVLELSGGCLWLWSASGAGWELTHSLEALCCEAGTDMSSCGSEKSEGREATE